MIVHAKDDPLVSYEAAQRAAGRIPGARLTSLETGGHLLIGQTEAIQRELASFLGPGVAGRISQSSMRVALDDDGVLAKGT